MNQHVVMILAVALGDHPLPPHFPLPYSNTHFLCFKVLALAAFLAFHLFQKYASTRRRPTPRVYADTPWVTLPRRYLSSYSNRWSPVNGFPSVALRLMGRLPLLHHWLRRQWPTSRTPEVVDIPFHFSFIVTFLKTLP